MTGRLMLGLRDELRSVMLPRELNQETRRQALAAGTDPPLSFLFPFSPLRFPSGSGVGGTSGMAIPAVGIVLTVQFRTASLHGMKPRPVVKVVVKVVVGCRRQ